MRPRCAVREAWPYTGDTPGCDRAVLYGRHGHTRVCHTRPQDARIRKKRWGFDRGRDCFTIGDCFTTDCFTIGGSRWSFKHTQKKHARHQKEVHSCIQSKCLRIFAQMLVGRVGKTQTTGCKNAPPVFASGTELEGERQGPCPHYLAVQRAFWGVGLPQGTTEAGWAAAPPVVMPTCVATCRRT